jgi:hypothetical protein
MRYQQTSQPKVAGLVSYSDIAKAIKNMI